MHFLARGIKRLLTLLVAGLLLAGCATGVNYQDLPQTLEIRLLPNASKQFIYRVGDDRAQSPRLTVTRSRGERQRERAERYSRPPGKREYHDLQERTAFVVAATGYCRTGYLELDYRLSRHLQWLRGECREGASSKDSKRFGKRHSLSLKGIDE